MLCLFRCLDQGGVLHAPGCLVREGNVEGSPQAFFHAPNSAHELGMGIAITLRVGPPRMGHDADERAGLKIRHGLRPRAQLADTASRFARALGCLLELRRLRVSLHSRSRLAPRSL